MNQIIDNEILLYNFLILFIAGHKCAYSLNSSW